MNLELDDLLQYGVMWATAGSSEDGSQRVVAPVEIRCRWELGSILVDSSLANNYQIAGRVFVDRVIALQSILWMGKLKDKPASPEPLVQVVDFKEKWDVKCRYARRTVIIAAWNGQLPPAIQ